MASWHEEKKAEKDQSRRILGIVYCHVCGCDTMPLDGTGRCAWCDTSLVKPARAQKPRAKNGRWEETPLPVPLPVPVGCCRLCAIQLPPASRYKKLFCCPAHRQAFWVRYTPQGRAWTRRHNRKKAAA